MFHLMIASGFLKREHPKYTWGSAAACDPDYVMITPFEEEVVDNDEEEAGNSEAEREEVFH